MNRRKFLTGLVAAPAIIRTPGLLMPVKKIIVETPFIRQYMIKDSLNRVRWIPVEININHVELRKTVEDIFEEASRRSLL